MVEAPPQATAPLQEPDADGENNAKVDAKEDDTTAVEALDEKTAVVVEAAPIPSPMSLLWPGYMCVFIDFMGLAITIPIQPFIAAEMGASPGQISAIVGVYSLGQLIGNIVMGKVSDKIGRKPVILMSVTLQPPDSRGHI